MSVVATIVCIAMSPLEATPETLNTLVEQYFRTDDKKERTALVSSIEKARNESIEVALVQAMRQVMVWEPMPRSDEITMRTPSGEMVSANYRGFADPDPICRGLVLCMPDDDEEADTNLTLNRATLVLGPQFYSSFVLVALNRPIGSSFHQSPSASDDLRFIIRELRKRIRVDTNRIYLFGNGRGGDAAWIASMFHPDFVAGAITLSAYPRLPYPRQLYPLLLGDLRNLPILSIWPTPEAGSSDARLMSIAAHNRAITELTPQLSLSFRGLETPFEQRRLGKLPEPLSLEREQLTEVWYGRPLPGKPVSFWFRYPAQGDLGWLRAAKTYGEVWTEDQLSIVVGPSTDRDAFITDVLKSKLFYLGGSVAGQTITIETKRIAEVELRLFEGMLDFSRPITVMINGRKRHEAMVKPSIPTLLESAYEEWEFQRLVFAKLSFSIRPDPSGE